ncbi:putative TIM-barrel fold metal-dependent hydrolase [Maritalea mobilis]|uniref:Putative TIM-barrel fold metal-dependent hydrolase n=1 Tax=Maritalea mobilis TaxID=483324 RepID=A0A4R6VTS9_9HYPH|nr:amidohydrolase family protein [Maritalea mobilis]TDQ66084.1 putative TIM-barrel fold metal-dependent hydrolase [Maritalea mobilis]
MKLIDTHQHLIYPNDLHYSWTDDVPVLAGKAFQIEDYQALVGEAIMGTVFMEAAVDVELYQDEVAFISQLSAKSGSGILGIVAAAYPELDGFDTWFQQSLANTDIVGYRRILHVVDNEMSQSERFRQNIRKLGEANKSFDMCFLQSQLSFAIEFAKACDNTQLILDHCGNPVLEAEQWDDWYQHMFELAQMEHVAIKISGITSSCPSNVDMKKKITPYIEACIQLFGWDRCVWGGDWPVVNLGQGLSHWIDLTHEIFAAECSDNRKKLYQSNAKQIYGLA